MISDVLLAIIIPLKNRNTGLHFGSVCVVVIITIFLCYVKASYSGRVACGS